MVHFIFSLRVPNPGESHLFLRDRKGLQSWASESLFIMKYSKYYQPKMGWEELFNRWIWEFFTGNTEKSNKYPKRPILTSNAEKRQRGWGHSNFDKNCDEKSNIRHVDKKRWNTQDTRLMFYKRLNERKEDPGYCCGLSIYIYRCPRKS